MNVVNLRFARYAYLVFSLASGYPVSLRAQNSPSAGKRIAVIRFDPAEQPLEASELFQILPLKSNTPLRLEDVRVSIERLFATGRYEDIQVDVQPAAGNAADVVVTFLTRAVWFVGHISVDGDISAPPNAGQIANAARL